jgi:hypothetical protein
LFHDSDGNQLRGPGEETVPSQPITYSNGVDATGSVTDLQGRICTFVMPGTVTYTANGQSFPVTVADGETPAPEFGLTGLPSVTVEARWAAGDPIDKVARLADSPLSLVVTVRNTGTVDVTNLPVEVAYPQQFGLAEFAHPDTGVRSAPSVGFVIPSLPAGSSESRSIPVHFRSPGELTAIDETPGIPIAVATDIVDAFPADNLASVRLTLERVRDLIAEAPVFTPPITDAIAIDALHHVTFVFRNDGDRDVADASLEVSFSSALDQVSAPVLAGVQGTLKQPVTPGLHRVVADVPNFPAGASASISLDVRYGSPRYLPTKAEFRTSITPGPGEENIENNRQELLVPLVLLPRTQGVGVEMTFSRSPLPLGAAAVVQVTVTNHGDTAASDVRVLVRPPDGAGPPLVAFTSGPSPEAWFVEFETDSAEFVVPDLPPGGSATATLPVVGRTQGGDLLRAHIPTPPPGDGITEDDSVTVVYEVGPPTGRVAGRAFDDANANGVLDPGEAVLPGVPVEIVDSGGGVHHTSTDENGEFLADGLLPGTTTVTIEPGQGGVPGGNSRTVTLESDTTTPANFGVTVPEPGTGAVTGTVWLDADGDGVREVGEPGLGNTKVLLLTSASAASESAIQTTFTNSGGRYIFNDVPPGQYWIRAEGSALFVQTFPRAVVPGNPAGLPPPTPATITAGSLSEAIDIGQDNWSEADVSAAARWRHYAPPAPDYPLRDVPRRGSPLVDTTYDGNRVRLGVAVSHTRPHPVSAVVRLRIRPPDQLPSEFDGYERSIIIPPESASTVAFEWDTYGHAWAGASSVPTRKFFVEVQTEGAEVREIDIPLHVRPRPIVAAHGLWSSAATWSGYPALVAIERPDWEFYAVGDGAYPGVMDTGALGFPTSTTIEQNSATLGTYIEAMRNDRQAVHIDLLGHSMGGLISRHYIHYSLPPTPSERPLAENLVMLGTPNEGSACATLHLLIIATAANGGGSQFAARANNLIQLTPRYLRREFNPTVLLRRGVRFAIAAGSAPLVGALPNFICISLPNDGIVEVSSALAENTPRLAFAFSTVVPVGHTSFPSDVFVFRDFVVPLLNDSGGPGQESQPAQAEPAADGWLPGPAEKSPPDLASDLAGLPQSVVHAGMVEVPPLASVEVPVVLSAAAGVAFMVIDNPVLESSVLAPDGSVVSTLGRPAGTWPGYYQTHVLESPGAGSYRVRITNASATAVESQIAAVEIDSPFTLAVQCLPLAHDDAVVVTAQLVPASGHTAPAVTSASAVVVPSSGPPRTVTLVDDGTSGDAIAGDGTYTGVTTGVPAGLVQAFVAAVCANGATRHGSSATTAPGSKRLTITRLPGSTSVRISWPDVLGPGPLQSATNLSEPAAWLDVPTVPTHEGDTYSVVLEPAAAIGFFRLSLGTE